MCYGSVMRYLPLVLLPLVLACTTKSDVPADDTSVGTDSAAGDSSTTDTVDTSIVCNTDNEECAPNVAGCGGEGVNMLPGAACLGCHGEGAPASGRERAPTLSAAGTLFADWAGTAPAANATVRITDSTGRTVTLTTSRVGNFETNGRLTPPLTAEVETSAGVRRMNQEVNTGDCNSCHACEGDAGEKMYAE